MFYCKHNGLVLAPFRLALYSLAARLFNTALAFAVPGMALKRHFHHVGKEQSKVLPLLAQTVPAGVVSRHAHAVCSAPQCLLEGFEDAQPAFKRLRITDADGQVNCRLQQRLFVLPATAP